MSSCDKYKELMMGLIDNELNPEELREIKTHLERCDECRREYEELKEMSEEIPDLTFQSVHDKELDRIWKQPYSRLSKVSGLALVIASWVVLVGYSVFAMFRESSEPKAVQIAIAASIIGFVVLLLSVLRDRIKSYKTDPYKEVKR
ncbi:zf-HC2 domain-containing protein [bacterium]|nr:zf-HC2 domain-containing protein [bacterium]